jgi:signal transduction histidine kinase/CHASE3 domain sensor protein
LAEIVKIMGIRLNRTIRQKLSQISQKHSIGKIGSILLGIPAVCLALVLLGVSDVREQERQIEQNIQMIEKRLKSSELILRYMIDQETGVRGYLLTQDEEFLQPYHLAKQALPHPLVELQQQSPDQRAILQRLEQQIQQRFQDSEKLLQFAQGIDPSTNKSLFNLPPIGRSSSSQLLSLLRQAKQSTDAIRQTVEDFKQQQQNLLRQKQLQLYDRKQFVDQVQLLGALLSVLSYVAVVSLFQLLDRGMVQRDEEIQQTQATIQTLTNHLVDGVIMLDRRGRIKSLNPAAERILGYSSESLTRRSLINVLFPGGLLAPPDASLPDASLPDASLPDASLPDASLPGAAKVISSRDAAAWVEATAATGVVVQLQAQQADGSGIPIELSISRSTSTLSPLIVLIRDVSERVQLTHALSDKIIELGKLNQQMLITNATLHRQSQSLETFVKVAAHDLKTPIRGIASLAQWLEADLGDSLTVENQTSLRLLNQRATRMQAIADGLLSYASIDDWVKRQSMVDTRVLVEEICRQIAVPASFTVVIKGEMPTLRTPHLALKLVFEQLIRNAIDHHDRGQGVIEIRATPKPHCTEFIVRDDGPGIAPAYRDRVLQLFQVLGQPPNAADKIGVGLALVYKTIQLVGGTLDLKSVTELGGDDAGRRSLVGDRGLVICFTWPFLEPQ